MTATRPANQWHADRPQSLSESEWRTQTLAALDRMATALELMARNVKEDGYLGRRAEALLRECAHVKEEAR